jgi:small subunit ribosomal protein S16
VEVEVEQAVSAATRRIAATDRIAERTYEPAPGCRARRKFRQGVCGLRAGSGTIPRLFFKEFHRMLKIRLRRQGATHAPFYRVVVSDSLKTPSAATVEQIGHYDPKKNPADVKIDRARVDYWVSKGAQLSPTVKSLLKKLPK